MNFSNFLAELKRRNVYKVAVAYGVVSWLVIQVATQVFPFFDVPNWAVRLVVILLLLGFPVALVLAWAFELTPSGIKRAEEVLPGDSITPQTGRKLAWLTALLALVAGGLLTTRILQKQSPRTPTVEAAAKMARSAVAEKSIAVLPFENLSEEKANAFFASGIQDEILTRLGKISALRVISRTSTRQYESKPGNLVEIAQALGVAYILEGSVQKVASQVRINVQLIKAATDEHVWAESYQRELQDIFGVEGEVAGTIAEALSARLTGAEKRELEAKPTNNVAAYEAYLRGLAAETTRAGLLGYKEAAVEFATATRLDPRFTLAWARLATIRSLLYFNGVDPLENTAAAVQEAVDKAMSLQPELGESWTAEAGYRYRVLRDFPGALKAYQRALERLPNNTVALIGMAAVERRMGRFEDANRHFRQADKLDPNNLSQLMTLGSDFLPATGRFEEALVVLERALRIYPGNPLALAAKASLFQAQGRLAESAAVLASIPTDRQTDEVVLAKISLWTVERRYEEVLQLLQEFDATKKPGEADPAINRFLLPIKAYFQLWTGRKVEAHETFVTAIAQLEAAASRAGGSLGDVNVRTILALAYAGLGDQAKALEVARRAVADFQDDAASRPSAELVLAQIEAMGGNAEAALELLPRWIDQPYGVTRSQLRLDPFWDSLREDPRFQRLATDPQPHLP